MDTSQNKILITGVAGLLGANFSRYLLGKGYEVCGIDNFSGGYEDFVDSRVLFKELNLIYADSKFCIEFMDKLFKDFNPDVVYHFAAYAAEGLSPFIRNFNYSSNLIGSVNIINNCVKYDAKLVFTSSMAVYGEGNPPFKEIDQPNPTDPYGIAKYSVEMDIKQAGDQFGLKYTIVRPHNIIGIYQNIWDKYRNVIGIWIRQVLNNEPITIFGDGEQTRAFSDIKFYMEPLEKLITEGDGEVFNLGADKEWKLKEVAELVKKVGEENGYKPEIKYLEARHEVKHAYCDHTKAKEILGFKDGTDIEETIREMFEWAKNQPDREVKQMRYEIDKGMYDYWR